MAGDMLDNVDPDLLKSMRSQGMSREQILHRVGLLEAATNQEMQEAIQKKPELLDPARRAQMQEKIQSAVETRMREIMADTRAPSLDEMRGKLKEAARLAAQDVAPSSQTVQSVNTGNSSGGSTSGSR